MPGYRRGCRGAMMGLAMGATALALGEAVPARASAQQPGAGPLVFDNVTVLDVVQGRRLPNQRVVIVGNHIQEVGDASVAKTPNGAQVVDARGKYLIPGLWDMHVHTVRAPELFDPLLLANGITGIRDAGSPVPLDTLRLWRKEILAGTRVGPPRQFFSGQAITNFVEDCNRRQWRDSTQTCVANSADAVHYVDSLKASGADMINPHDVYPPMYFTIAAEARRLGLPFGGRTWDDFAIAASDSGALLIDHLDPRWLDRHALAGLRWRCWAGLWPAREGVRLEPCQPVAELFKRHNTWLVPTLIVDQIAESGGDAADEASKIENVTMTEKAQAMLARFRKRIDEFWGGSLLHGNWLADSTNSAASRGSAADSLGILRIIQRAGLPVAAGTDAGVPAMKTLPPGFALHAELAMYVAEGLTPLNALQSATLNPAQMWHAADSLGTIAPGKLADVVLLDADPLVDITNTTTIRAVVANGRYYDRAALDSLLAKAQARRP